MTEILYFKFPAPIRYYGVQIVASSESEFQYAVQVLREAATEEAHFLEDNSRRGIFFDSLVWFNETFSCYMVHDLIMERVRLRLLDEDLLLEETKIRRHLFSEIFNSTGEEGQT